MASLMKFEMKRFNLKNKIIACMLCNLFICSVTCLMFFVERETFGANSKSFDGFITLVMAVDSLTFMIFAGVLLSILIASEYKDKTIMVLFTYPVSRKKIIFSKILIVLIFTFVNIIIGAILTFGILFTAQLLTNTVVISLSVSFFSKLAVKILFTALVNTMVALLPAIFAVKYGSPVKTIVSSVIITAVLQSNANGFSLSQVVFIPVILSVVSFILLWYSISILEKEDIRC